MLGTGFSTDWFKSEKLGSRYTDVSLDKTMSDLRAAGFTNLRLRSRADLFGFPDPAGAPAAAMDAASMRAYLAELDKVARAALRHDIIPVVSWIHFTAEERASKQDGDNFVAWWKTLAEHFANADPRIGFNLMTELGKQGDERTRLYDHPAVYNDWTRRAIAAIRAAGGANTTRNIIVTAPQNGKLASLERIGGGHAFWTSPECAGHVLFELHDYAAGPNDRRRAWKGDGTPEQRESVTATLDGMVAFTRKTGAPGYFGAWMPLDNKGDSVTPEDSKKFARFVARETALRGIPWSMNELDLYYDTLAGAWKKTAGKRRGAESGPNIEGLIDAVREGRKTGAAARAAAR